MSKTILILLSLASIGFCSDRKLTTTLNPDCGDCSNDTTVLYTRGDGLIDSLHQIWDFSRGEPTIIIASTHLNNSVTIIWKNGKPSDFAWNYPTIYSFAVVIHQVWEYSDVNDTGIWMPGLPTRKLHSSSLVWKRQELLHGDDLVTLKLSASLPSSNGTMQLGLRWLSFSDYATLLPHLIHTANSSLLEVSLSDAAVGVGPCSRLALLLLLASSDRADSHWVSRVTATLDDEHTPGIFEVVEVVSPSKGFLQYRPVSYTSPEREVTASTLAQVGFLNGTRGLPGNSTAAAWYRHADADDVLVQALLVSFGSRNDGCYMKSNYTSWSVSVIYGDAPKESWSSRVLAWLCFAFSLPLLLLIGYILCKRLCCRTGRRVVEQLIQ